VTVVSLPALLLSGLALALVVMTLAWLLAERVRNASLVDVAWSFLFTPLVWLYVWVGGQDGPRQILMATLVSVWSLRLGWHLMVRVMADHPREDSRYEQLRRDWSGTRVSLRFFWFFQAQALAAVGLTGPMAVVAADSEMSIGSLQLAGAALWLFGVLGEGVADWQLSRFRSHPRNHGEVCREGLWRYSRHPNYFFEWVVWCGFFVVALGSPGGVPTIYAPLLVLYILLAVTGVPTSEAASLRSRGDKYRAYQRTTSVFVPWFPRPA
jgi:steroid 5-alpha reductase family enzyme